MNRIESCFLFGQELTPCCGREHFASRDSQQTNWQLINNKDSEPIPALIFGEPRLIGSNWVSPIKLNPRFFVEFAELGLEDIQAAGDFFKGTKTIKTPVFCYCPLLDNQQEQSKPSLTEAESDS